MKKLVILLLILFGLMLIIPMVGCESYCMRHHCKSSIKIKDSVYISRKDSTYINIKDSVIIKEGGSVNIDLGDPCDSLTGKLKEMNLRFKNGINNTVINTSTGRLLINSDCESQIERYRNQVSLLQNQLSDSQYHHEQEIKVIEKPLTRWQQLKISRFGDVTALLTMVLIIYCTYRLFGYDYKRLN